MVFVFFCMQKLHELENGERKVSHLRSEDDFEKEHWRIRESELREQMIQKVCFLIVHCALFFHFKNVIQI